MNKILSILIVFGVALASGQNVVPPDSRKSTPIRIEPFNAVNSTGFAEQIFNFDLTPSGTTNDTVWGNVFDIRKLAVKDSLLGQAQSSCYDISDSSGVADSVNVRLNIMGYEYASNNSDPLAPHSDVPYSIRTWTGTAISDGSAKVDRDTTRIFISGIRNTQFIRAFVENLSTGVQNTVRCRIWLFRRPVSP